MSGNQCHCGKPIQDTGSLCPACGELLRRNLHKIADRWPELEKALSERRDVGVTNNRPEDEKPHCDRCASREGERKLELHTGTYLNAHAVRARRACTDAVWFTVQIIRDDLDTAGRPFTPPPASANRSQDDTPRIARWLATWHVAHITHRTERETAEEIAHDVERAERLTYEVTETSPPRQVPTGMACEGHTTNVEGERAPCRGVMRATLGDQMPDLVCSEDATHRIPPDVWSRNYWKRAHTMERVG